MDDEKLQKTIEFILNNQAQFTVDIQKTQEAHKEVETRFSGENGNSKKKK